MFGQNGVQVYSIMCEMLKGMLLGVQGSNNKLDCYSVFNLITFDFLDDRLPRSSGSYKPLAWHC